VANRAFTPLRNRQITAPGPGSPPAGALKFTGCPAGTGAMSRPHASGGSVARSRNRGGGKDRGQAPAGIGSVVTRRGASGETPIISPAAMDASSAGCPGSAMTGGKCPAMQTRTWSSAGSKTPSPPRPRPAAPTGPVRQTSAQRRLRHAITPGAELNHQASDRSRQQRGGSLPEARDLSIRTA
jgi:hypothetical protein